MQRPEKAPEHISGNGESLEKKEPKINVKFFFGKHGTREDFNEVVENLKDADVFIPESLGWTKESLKVLQRISNGAKEDRKLTSEFNGWSDAFVDSIRGTKKIIQFIDVPEGPLAEKIKRKKNEAQVYYKAGVTAFFNGSFDESIRQSKEHFQAVHLETAWREKAMVQNLKNLIDKLIRQNPTLGEKGEVRVLVFLGQAHTDVHHVYRRNAKASLKMQNKLTVNNTDQEVPNRLKKGMTIDDLLYARGMFEGFLVTLFEKTEFEQHRPLIRAIADLFSLDELREFSQDLLLIEKTEENIFSLVKKKMHEKGVAFPRNRSEADAFAPKRSLP